MVKTFKPCPWCNGSVSVTSSREFFDKQVEKTGSFGIHVECPNCDVEMWVFRETDFDEAVEHLMEKWNRRGGEDDE